MGKNIAIINNIRWNFAGFYDNRSTEIVPISIVSEWKEINRLPLVDGDIYFNHDFWDFTKVNSLYRFRSDLQYDFENISYAYKDYVKGIIIKFIIQDRMAFSTIKDRFNKLLRLTNYFTKKHIYDFDLITLKVVQDYYQTINKNTREDYKKLHKNTIKEFLKYINVCDPQLDYSLTYRYLEEYSHPERIKAERESGKTPDIPKHYFNSLISCALKDIYNISLDSGLKKDACMILLLSQVGMRVGELRLIEANKKKEIRIFDETESVFYLEFKTHKTIKGNSYKWTKSFLTDKAVLAYDTLEKITKEDRAKYDTELLLFNHKKNRPYHEQIIRNRIMKFVARHKHEIDCINKSETELPGFVRKVIDKRNVGGSYYIPLKFIEDLEEGDSISCPNPHQFRVAVCTRMVEDKKNIDLDWIREHMNHLTEEMTIHYIRKKEQSKKDREFARGILKSVVTEEFRLIGHDATILTEKIKEFINNNKYNVKKDLDTIINELEGKIPIREKADGFCIKSAFGRKCALDGLNEEIYCAFGLCPNHCFCYKNVDITYERYVSKKKVIEYNLQNGFRAEAEKEANKLKRLIDERLLPELNELKYEIDRQGLEIIKNKNSNIINLIENLDTIIIEVKQWETPTTA